jgi:AcrR family transcriptional regulator
VSSETQQRILDTARRLFNQEGVSRVGVRDVARAVGLSAGNLSYHFATKDDLVAALVRELHDANQQHIFAALPADFSLVALYRAALAALRSMVGYRAVLLGYVEAVAVSRELGALEKELAARRFRRHEEMLALLVGNGWVARAALARSERIFEQSSFISSGWLGAARLRGWSDARAIPHFARLGCALLEPWCTPKGTRQMRRILAGQEG